MLSKNKVSLLLKPNTSFQSVTMKIDIIMKYPCGGNGNMGTLALCNCALYFHCSSSF